MASFIIFCCIIIALSISAAAAENQANPLPAEAPKARKLGKHAPPQSPAAGSPGAGESGGATEEEVMESSHLNQQHIHHHRSFEKSVIGGVAVVGVLAAVFLTAVFCYIRATRRRPVQPCSPTHDSSMEERKMIGSASPSVK